MPVMMGAIEAPQGIAGNRNKPRLLCRGRMRKQVKKALASLETLLARDHKENDRALALEYTPYLFVDTIGSALERKVEAVINACYERLQDREG